MKFSTAFFLFMVSTFILKSQTNFDEYRSASNPLYWKNKMPYAGYWQQDVHYEINADIDETTNVLTGTEKLTYYNNSPDTLRFVYFHLYQNLTLPGGPLSNLNEVNHVKATYSDYEKEGLAENISSLTVDGVELKREQDYTVMKVYLLKPLAPNSSTTFNISFKTYWSDGGSNRRRFKMFKVGKYTHYDGVHWYPRICVYDRKFGWDTYQHLGHEFYGDYGSYDVSLTFSSNYIVEGTGELINSDEAMPDTLRQKLDIKNFKTHSDSISVIIPYNHNQRKTWLYHAVNVHDFAFTADPTYRIGEANWNGVRVIALAQEPDAPGWQDAAAFTANVIRVYSMDFGMYEWPKIVVADARDGMEYPMITLDGGTSPGYYSLLAHEVGHEWFFGMIGNNETYRACLDEGFTQFIESWCLINLTGNTVIRPTYKNKYYDHFKNHNDVKDQEVYLGYLNDAVKGTDMPINTQSDMFNSAIGHGGGYRQVYYRTATMLWNLQYVMGDSLFEAAMQHYVSQWKMCHPYVEDFRNSIIQFSHMDLNWFFDEWMEGTKSTDYKVCSAKHLDGNSYIITLKRKGSMQMPIDFTVVNKDGKKFSYYIPNTYDYKKTNADTLKRWYGWDKMYSTYTDTISIEGKLKNVMIDTAYRLADINQLNNALHVPVDFKFDSHVSNINDRRHYTLRWSPDVWYNSTDFIQAGLHLSGNYMNVKHIFSLSGWFNTKSVDYEGESLIEVPGNQRLAYLFSYKNNINRFIKNTTLNLGSRWLDGLMSEEAGIDIAGNDNNTLHLNLKCMMRPSTYTTNYLINPSLWETGKWNNTIAVGLTHKYQYIHGNGNIDLNLKSSTLFSNSKYAQFTFSVINKNTVGKFDINTRTYLCVGTGNTPDESKLYMAGSSPEEMMNNRFTRAAGFVPDAWTTLSNTTNHFQSGGGLNLRGYSGYTAVETTDDGQSYLIYNGNSGAAVNAELEFDRLLKFQPKIFKNTWHLDSYLFADAGTMAYTNINNKTILSAPRADAGVGFALTLKKIWMFETFKPLTFRIDFPLLLNRTPFVDQQFAQFRFVVGVNRCF